MQLLDGQTLVVTMRLVTLTQLAPAQQQQASHEQGSDRTWIEAAQILQLMLEWAR